MAIGTARPMSHRDLCDQRNIDGNRNLENKFIRQSPCERFIQKRANGVLGGWQAASDAGRPSAFVRALAFTPVRSPENNGTSEAFVKTLKRDHAGCPILPDAETSLRLIPEWIEDQGESRPHSGLRFLSPREFGQGAKSARSQPASRPGKTGCIPLFFLAFSSREPVPTSLENALDSLEFRWRHAA